MPLSLWEIDGEHLIAASSERDMRSIYLDYHGESIRGHDRRLVDPGEMIVLVDSYEERSCMPASEAVMCFGRGYFPARS